MKEIWRDIKDYEGLYQVSNMGRVKSLNYARSGKEGMMKPHYDKYGYLYVCLSKNSKGKKYKIHRLIAQAFIPNPENKSYIDHIDRNPSNNKIENLRWVTPKENSNNANTISTFSSSQYKKWEDPEYREHMSLVHSKPILQIDRETGEVIKEWSGAPEVEKELGISRTNICGCCNKKPHYHTAGGYKWEYKEKGVA